MDNSIIVFYFFLGVLLQLPDLAIRFFLIDLGIEVATLSAFQATMVIPWCLKPLYGFVSDNILICKLRRKPYIILCNLLCMIVWLVMYTLEDQIWVAQCLLVLASVFTCFTDVMYDSILVEIAKKEHVEDHGKAQSWCWGARAAGAFTAAAMGGFLLKYMKPQDIFILEAVILLLVAVVACALIDEQPTVRGIGARQQCRAIVEAMKNPSLWKPAIFVFVFAATPSSYTAFFYFLVNELKFTSGFLGVLTCVRHVAMMAGTYAYSRWFRNVPYRTFFIILIVLSAVMGASPVILVTHMNTRIGLPNSLFAAGDDLFLSVIGQIALMPCLVLAAKLCPKGIEASLYASFVSILNFAGIVSEYSGALITHLMGVTKNDFDKLPELIMICTFTSLIPLLFIKLLDHGTIKDVVERNRNRELELI